MEKRYRGFILTSTKEKLLSGDYGVQMSAVREIDGWFLDDSVNISMRNASEGITDLRITVDDYYENPKEYEAPIL